MNYVQKSTQCPEMYRNPLLLRAGVSPNQSGGSANNAPASDCTPLMDLVPEQLQHLKAKLPNEPLAKLVPEAFQLRTSSVADFAPKTDLPDVECFTSGMECILKFKDPSHAKQARKRLLELKDLLISDKYKDDSSVDPKHIYVGAFIPKDKELIQKTLQGLYSVKFIKKPLTAEIIYRSLFEFFRDCVWLVTINGPNNFVSGPNNFVRSVYNGLNDLISFIKDIRVQENPKPEKFNPDCWWKPLQIKSRPTFDEKSAKFIEDHGSFKNRVTISKFSSYTWVNIEKYPPKPDQAYPSGGSRGSENPAHKAEVHEDDKRFMLRYSCLLDFYFDDNGCCYFKIENEGEGEPEIIRLTSGSVKDEYGNTEVAIQLKNERCNGASQLIWNGMTEDQIQSAVELTWRKPVIYYYGYHANTTISTAVTLDPRLSFYELIPGFNHVVNINKASWMALSRLPGIGTQRAKRIVNNRPKGGYLQVTDILEIKGIGAKTFDAINPFIGVDDTPTHWVVNQSPKNDGSVIDIKDNNAKYPYLFWEANAPHGVFTFNVDQSFCVKKDVLTSFLTEKLAVLGLNKKESADFIEFWVPLLTGDSFKMYPYVMVEFMEENYTDLAALAIHPQPDQVIRVFAHFQLSAEPITCGEPELTPVTRMDHGRVVVEWGGTERVPDSMPNVGTSVKAPHYAMHTG